MVPDREKVVAAREGLGKHVAVRHKRASGAETIPTFSPLLASHQPSTVSLARNIASSLHP